MGLQHLIRQEHVQHVQDTRSQPAPAGHQDVRQETDPKARRSDQCDQ